MAPNDPRVVSGESAYQQVEGLRPRGPRSAPEGSLRVSAALILIAERLRTRFGIAPEVLSTHLLPVIPAGGGDFYRAIERSDRTRRDVLAALDGGRITTVDAADASYVLHPLRHGRAAHGIAGLLAVRRDQASPGESPPHEATEPWLDFLKTALETDLATAEGLRDERLQARRTSAALRFIAQLVTIDSEEELARVVVHAAAVWFDVDARLYRRDLAGDFVLHTHLPGISGEPQGRLPALLLGDGRQTLRLPAPAGSDDLRWATPEALLVPIAVSGSTEWVLALGGVLPEGAQMVFETVAQTMGSHLSRLAAAYRTAVRRQFESDLMRADHPRELVTLDALRRLVHKTGAASGVVTLFDGERSQRLAAVGEAAIIDAPPAAPVFAPERVVVPMPVGRGRCAVMHLAPPPGGTLPVQASVIVNEVAPLLRVFLTAALRQEAPVSVDVELPSPAFEARITEELARAKRFDLGLSMLIIDVDRRAVDTRVISQVIAGVRAELRGSDLLGIVGSGRIAVLLVHTDGSGVSAVVGRMRRCLAALLQSVGVPELRLGRAVLEGDCHTASDLLSRASLNLEDVAAS